MTVATITADLVRNLKPPPSGQTILRDDKLKGFALRITANGAISFLVHVTKKGVERHAAEHPGRAGVGPSCALEHQQASAGRLQ